MAIPCPHRDCFVAFGSSQRQKGVVIVSGAWQSQGLRSLFRGISEEVRRSRNDRRGAQNKAGITPATIDSYRPFKLGHFCRPLTFRAIGEYYISHHPPCQGFPPIFQIFSEFPLTALPRLLRLPDGSLAKTEGRAAGKKRAVTPGEPGVTASSLTELLLQHHPQHHHESSIHIHQSSRSMVPVPGYSKCQKPY